MRKLWLLGATGLATLALEAPALAAGADEIIVTARKREESLQDVPVSATVLTSEDIEELVLESFEDYVRQIPGATFISSGPDYLNDIAVRGQGAGRLGFSESATGIYRNGIYSAGGGFGGRSFNRLDTFDVARVEVYRGPQGALYGRNAVGGAVNLISERPKDKYEARAAVGFGTYNAFNAEVVANVPIVADKLAVRAGGFFQEQDGFHKRVEDGVDIDPRTYYGGRLGVGIKPWEGGDGVVTIEHFESHAPAFGTTGRNPNKDPGAFLHGSINRTPPANILENTIMLDFEQDLGWADLTVLGVYKFRRGGRLREDLDHFQATGSPATDNAATQSEHYERWGSEVRLASPQSQEGWNWLVGADWQMSDEVVDARNQSLATYAISAAVQFEDLLSSYSGFGLIGYDVTDRLNLAVEGRVIYDDKEFIGTDLCAMVGMACTFVPRTTSVTEHWLRVTPGLTATYKVSPDHTVYGRFATGYRPGGFNQNNITLGGTTTFAYGPEYNFSYEAGWKANFFDRHLQVNTAIFYSYTDGIQIPLSADAAAGIASTSLVNAGDAKLYGGELELRGRTEFLAGDLVGVLGLSSVLGSYSEGSRVRVGTTDVDLSNKRVEEARDYMVNLTLIYTQPLFNTGWKTSLVGSFQAEGGGYEDALGSAKLPGGRDKDNFALADFRWSVFDEHWRVSAFAKNAFNQNYELRVLSGNIYHNDPQTFGIDLSVKW